MAVWKDQQVLLTLFCVCSVGNSYSTETGEQTVQRREKDKASMRATESSEQTLRRGFAHYCSVAVWKDQQVLFTLFCVCSSLN